MDFRRINDAVAVSLQLIKKINIKRKSYLQKCDKLSSIQTLSGA
ncbi:hypothetical protein SAMN04488125_10169 [Methylorubrum salsuginis]|uniref:Uncharacterized protein n=1 Tax=Methylorubrum salsuginis TaxID=414703 RepID=A0A1I3Y6I8_9HYPH|nr:hypothetical protein SAMN04488125_10169 [Methylorubrum salsuginis]